MTTIFKSHYASLQWNRNSVDLSRPMGLLYYYGISNSLQRGLVTNFVSCHIVVGGPPRSGNFREYQGIIREFDNQFCGNPVTVTSLWCEASRQGCIDHHSRLHVWGRNGITGKHDYITRDLLKLLLHYTDFRSLFYL